MAGQISSHCDTTPDSLLQSWDVGLTRLIYVQTWGHCSHELLYFLFTHYVMDLSLFIMAYLAFGTCYFAFVYGIISVGLLLLNSGADLPGNGLVCPLLHILVLIIFTFQVI